MRFIQLPNRLFKDTFIPMTSNSDSGNVGSVVLAMPQVSDECCTSIGCARAADELLQFRPVTSLSATEFTALERLAFEHGQAPDSYLAVESHRHCFLAQDHSAAVSAIVSGSYIHISGGILAPLESRRQIIIQLARLARQTKILINCYAIGEQDRPLFEDAGWEVSKFGEDTSLKLESLSWSGKPFEWVRRQVNYCQRMGLSCREVSQEMIDKESWQELTEELIEIQQDDFRNRVYSCELDLLVGKLQPASLGRRRLFIAENRERTRIEAFVVANPMRKGKAWAFEMYRKRQDAPRGAMPFLIKWIIDALKAEGVEEASLCMLLWKGTHTFKGKRTSLLVRWGLAVAYHLGDALYNTKGITHFKTRFRPDLSNCYVCVTPKVSILSCINFFHTIGAFSCSPRSLLRNAWRCLFLRKSGRD
jgi:phosphatidylglycerol lysyltransferase